MVGGERDDVCDLNAHVVHSDQRSSLQVWRPLGPHQLWHTQANLHLLPFWGNPMRHYRSIRFLHGAFRLPCVHGKTKSATGALRLLDGEFDLLPAATFVFHGCRFDAVPFADSLQAEVVTFC